MNRNSKNEEKESLLHKYVRSYNSNIPNMVEDTEKILNNDPPEGSEVSEENTETQEPKPSSSWPGYLLCILSGLCFIACNLCIKLASSDFPVSSWQMLFVRCLVQKVCMIPVLCWIRESVLGPSGDYKTRIKLGAQATISGCLLLCYFEGIRRLPLGDFGAIAFSSPAFTMVLSIFMLKEHCGIYRCLVAIILTVGVVLISRPPILFSDDGGGGQVVPHAGGAGHTEVEIIDYLGIIFALAGSALSAWVTIIANYLCRQLRHVHFSIQVFWFSLGGEIISLLGMLLLDTTSIFSRWTVFTWLMAVGQGVLGLIGTIFILLALHWISPTKNKVIRSFQVVASYIIQVEVFGTIPHISDYVGAVMIVMAVLGITMEDMIMRATKIGEKCAYF